MPGLPRKNSFPIIRAVRGDHSAPGAERSCGAPPAEDTTSLGPSPAATAGDDRGRLELEGSDAEAYATLRRRRAERRRRRRIKRGIIAAIIFALIGIAALAATVFTKPTRTGPQQVTEQVDSGTFTSEIDAHGTLEARFSTAISPTIDGTIAEVRVTEGQAVNKGDVLMIISNRELDVAVADAKRSLRDAQADLAVAKQSAGGEGRAADAQSGIAAAQRAVESAQAALDQAQSKANERTVSAPATGRIVNLIAQVGASLSDGAKGSAGSGALMQIADLSQMKLTLQVAEEDVAAAAVGQTADITFPAFDGLNATGIVTGIASAASSDSTDSQMSYGASNAVTFAVDLLIAEPDGRLKPGMTAEAKIQTRRLDNVVMVPLVAVRTHDEASFVTVRTDGERASGGEEREVTVYAKNGDVAVIGRVAGSTPGDGEQDMAEAPLKKGDTLIVSGGDDSGASAGGSGATS